MAGEVQLARSYAPFGDVLSGERVGTAYGYTGEWTDATGLVYLRARYYAPWQGRFITRDPWSGEVTRPGSLHKWVYVENNPINAVDPQGLKQYRIWAAAFISPEEIVFPHVYAFPLGIDPHARWHGDNRGFLGSPPSAPQSSRVWHEVTIDTDPLAPEVVGNNNFSDTGYTSVKYLHDGIPAQHVGKAQPPPKATVSKEPTDRCITKVDIGAKVSNPLEHGSPPVYYEYHLVFNLREGKLSYWGSNSYSYYPWHELYVSGGFAPLRQFTPPVNTPVLLCVVVPFAFQFAPWSQPIPADGDLYRLIYAQCGCSQ